MIVGRFAQLTRDDLDPDGQAERRRPNGLVTDLLKRIVSGRTKAHELHTLLPWVWAEEQTNRNAPAIAA